MKKIFSILILAPLLSFSQVKIIDNDSAWIFTRVVDIDSTNQLKLFGRANEWFVKEGYNRSKSFINENSTGKIQTQVLISSDVNGATFCDIIFIAKDNKYKLTFSGFYHSMAGPLSQEKSGKVSLGIRFSNNKWAKIKDFATLFKNVKLDNFIRYMNGIKKEGDF